VGWKDLLQTPDERIVAPWVGGRSLRSHDRSWRLEGKLPPEHGWHSFRLKNRKVEWVEAVDAEPDVLKFRAKGYLVGDRLVPDEARVETDPAKLAEFEQVLLVELGLDRFIRVEAGRPSEGGPLVYIGQEFPLGPEDEVQMAFLDRRPSVDDVSGVAPALDAAFRFESWQRSEAERRRVEEEERRRQEEARQRVREAIGDGATRRAVAQFNFAEGATAALRVGGAKYLDSRESANKGEMVVQFRFRNRTFECTCDRYTLGIIDAGICLQDHGTGEKGDTHLTLESFPAVLAQAIREGRLVVWRRVGGQNYGGYDDGHDEDDYYD